MMSAPDSRDPTETSRFRETYHRQVWKRMLFILAGIAACIIVALYSVTLGPYPVTFSEAYSSIWAAIINLPYEDISVYHAVVDLRLPSILAAIVSGVAFAVCGAAMQGMLKNPLADPYTMGISSGAGFGAALALILGIELVAGGGVVINAFVFALIPMLVILFMSRLRRATPTMMILCGTSLMYIFNALTQLFMIVADPDDLSAAYKWMVGSLSDVTYGDILVFLMITAVGSLVIMLMSNRLNLMSMGDDHARTMGINVDRERLLILVLITVIAASVVSFTGVIGFVGLVAPHIARIVVGSDHKYLIPASAVLGALLMLFADIVSRTLTDTVLPVGVVTACIGGPLFMFLILRSGKEAWS